MKCRICKKEMSYFRPMNDSVNKFLFTGYVCLECLKFIRLSYDKDSNKFVLIEEDISFEKN